MQGQPLGARPGDFCMSALNALANPLADPLGKGRQAMAERDFARAAAEFLAASTTTPADPEPRYWLASALIAGGEAEAAEQAMADARNLHAVAVIRAAGADM